MMNLVMTDLKSQYESIKEEIDSAIKEVINESSFILGKQVSLFEGEVCRYFGVTHAVGVASGTDALVLALIASGIQNGDEVITTPFTFIATAEAVSRVGAKPVFCDIAPDTFNIDPEKITMKLTKKTKAIIPVHLYGLPCEMDSLISLSKKYNLKIIEDCAQSFGSEYRNAKVGTFGECGCLSFFPAKTLGCFGDGGMVITNDERTAVRLRLLRNHGSSNKYEYTIHGFNSRLDSLQAALLRVKLKYIDAWIAKRIENAHYYNECLRGVSGIITPSVPAYVKHSFNYYTIAIKENRDSVQKNLKARGIPSAVYYPLSLHLQEVYKGLGYRRGDFPVAEQAQERVLSFPLYPELTSEQIQHICGVSKGIVGANNPVRTHE